MKLGESNLKKVMVLLCVCALSLLLTAIDCGYGQGGGIRDYSQHLPKWSQDGKSIVFPFNNALYMVATDGSRLEVVARGGGILMQMHLLTYRRTGHESYIPI